MAVIASPFTTGGPSFTATGLTGATASSRYVGGTASGPPTTGTFALGDFVVDQTGLEWVCTAAGSPGTWAAVGMGLKAQTPAAGYTLINGTGTIISWTAPNDGLNHRAIIYAILDITSGTTGGQVTFTFTDPAGTVTTNTQLISATHAGTGVTFIPTPPNLMLPIKANTTLTISQNTALSGGSAVVFAEIWGA